MPVAVACAGCGKLHEFSQIEAIAQVWCSGCGELIEAKEGVLRKRVGPPVTQATLWIPTTARREIPVEKSRPISVHVILLAGALAVLMEILAVLSSVLTGGPTRLFFARIIFHPWWIFLLVWVGLLCKSRRAARIAATGGAIVAFLLCNYALRQQIVEWGVDPPWSELIWGTVRVMFRSFPLLAMAAALGTRSAREYFFPPEST